MRIAIIIFIFFASISAEVNSFFYQPLIRDSIYTYEQIDMNLKRLKKQGLTKIFIQWTNYDSYDFLEDKHFNRFVDLLFQNQIQIVFGLYFDDKYYKQLDKGNLSPYFKQLRKKHFVQYEKLIKRYDRTQLGFYLPEEIDDVHFKTPENFEILKTHLSIIKEFLPANRVYFSSFFTGKLPPKEYARFVKMLQDSSGVIPLIQDGMGTNRLNKYEMRLYLENIAQTFVVKPTIILEVFTMDKGKIFPQKDESVIEEQKSYLQELGFESVSLFSFRYLIRDIK